MAEFKLQEAIDLLNAVKEQLDSLMIDLCGMHIDFREKSVREKDDEFKHLLRCIKSARELTGDCWAILFCEDEDQKKRLQKAITYVNDASRRHKEQNSDG